MKTPLKNTHQCGMLKYNEDQRQSKQAEYWSVFWKYMFLCLFQKYQHVLNSSIHVAAACKNRLALYYFVLIFGTSSMHWLLDFNDPFGLHISIISQIYRGTYLYNALYYVWSKTLCTIRISTGSHWRCNTCVIISELLYKQHCFPLVARFWMYLRANHIEIYHNSPAYK